MTVPRPALVVLAVLIAVQLVALYLPGSLTPGPPLFPGDDKVTHFLLFAGPAFVLGRWVAPRWPVVLLGLHAPVSEFLQLTVIPRRSGEILDLAADLAGVAAGWLIGRWLRAGQDKPATVDP